MGAPVRYTCPTVDETIEAIRECLEGTTKIQDIMDSDDGDTNGSVRDEIGEIEYKLNMMLDNVEELRESNRKLRDWGEELESELEDTKSRHEEEVRGKDMEIDELESRIGDLERLLESENE